MVLQGEVCWARKYNQAGQDLGKAQKYLPFTSVAPKENKGLDRGSAPGELTLVLGL